LQFVDVKVEEAIDFYIPEKQDILIKSKNHGKRGGNKWLRGSLFVR